MVSRSVTTFVTLALAAFASAQSSSASGSASGGSSSPTSQAMPPVATQAFDVAQVNATLKQQFCLSQTNTCPEICGGSIKQNRCDDNTLEFQCVCLNGTVPDVTAYKGTIPFFACQQTFQQCIASHPNDLDGQTTCKNNEQCGNLTAESPSASTSSSSSGSATSSSASNLETMPSATGGGSSTSSSSSSQSSGAASSLLHEEVGMSVFAATVLAALKFLL